MIRPSLRVAGTPLVIAQLHRYMLAPHTVWQYRSEYMVKIMKAKKKGWKIRNGRNVKKPSKTTTKTVYICYTSYSLPLYTFGIHIIYILYTCIYKHYTYVCYTLKLNQKNQTKQKQRKRRCKHWGKQTRQGQHHPSDYILLSPSTYWHTRVITWLDSLEKKWYYLNILHSVT